MLRANIINPTIDPRWDEFVENHPWGWICHLSKWGKILEQCFKHIKGYYLALVDENDQIRAGLPIFSVRSWLTGNRLVSIPHGTLCDPLVSSANDMDQMLEATIKLANTLVIPRIEVRTFMSSSLFRDNAFVKDNYYKHHYLSLMPDPEQLKKSFHRTCVRQRITRALNSNLEVKIANNVSELAGFYKLHTLTRKRHGLPPQPYSLFELLWERFHPLNRIAVLTAFWENKPVASLVLFKFKNRVSAEFAASDDASFEMSPNHLLFWEAIRLSCHEGYEVFDFGRTPPSNEKLMDFKRHWGTKMVDLPQFFYGKQLNQRVRQDDKFSYKAVRAVCHKIPDRFLPLFGRFVYNHLG